MVLQKPVGTTRLENAEIFRKVRKTTFPRSPPGQSLCQWRQKGVSRPNWGGVAVDFHDAQLENQTSDRLRIGGNLLVTNSSIDCESFISGLSSPLILKTIGNRKGDCAWSCSRWQTQPEKISKSQRTNQCHSLCTLNWFVLCNLLIFSGCLSPRTTSRTISFSISNSF